jgi:hypothetical protein
MYLDIIATHVERGIIERYVKVEKIQGVYFVDEDDLNGKTELSIFLSGITGAGAKVEVILLADDEGDSISAKNCPEGLRNLIESFLSRQGLM